MGLWQDKAGSQPSVSSEAPLDLRNPSSDGLLHTLQAHTLQEPANPPSEAPKGLLESDPIDLSASRPRLPGSTDAPAPRWVPSFAATSSATPHPSSSQGRTTQLRPKALLVPSPRLISTPPRGSPKAPGHPHSNPGPSPVCLHTKPRRSWRSVGA